MSSHVPYGLKLAPTTAMGASVAPMLDVSGEGTFTAVFSTMGTIDKDGDVTLTGAFDHGATVPISAYGHGTTLKGSLPVGTGRIRTTDREAFVDGRFFLDTDHGLNTYRTVKALHAAGLGEWSYGFRVDDYEHDTWNGQRVRLLKRLRVSEVSPVLEGAGIGVRTVDVAGEMPDDIRAIYDQHVQRRAAYATDDMEAILQAWMGHLRRVHESRRDS